MLYKKCKCIHFGLFKKKKQKQQQQQQQKKKKKKKKKKDKKTNKQKTFNIKKKSFNYISMPGSLVIQRKERSFRERKVYLRKEHFIFHCCYLDLNIPLNIAMIYFQIFIMILI